MEIGTILHGFRLARKRDLAELQASLWEMEHCKTGAQLAWLERADENKAFSIAFKTLPTDSTGVFHILEHSVLCGSDKYPVKEPFVELLKTSVQTFLNAITFPDKTVYPITTRNDKDYLNLMDVYLDAVFHPAIYSKPEIFRQEGWRYENPAQTPVYQGVVFNEMKGAFGSPQTVLENAMNALLFPDTCYRWVSGGDPACIPDLTYEQFLAMHRKYYHPSNARISLVGSVNLDAALEKLDSFLRDYDRLEADFTIPMQTPVAARTETIPYEIGQEEPTEQRTIICCGTLMSRFDQHKRLNIASILADYLAGDNDAPLKRAILDAGLGQDVTVSIHDGQQQNWISWDVWNTDADKLPRIRQTVRETLARIADEGLDPQRLRACCNAYAFHLRDRDGGWGPRSLSEALSMLDTWLYGGDPAEGLLVEDSLIGTAVDPDPAGFTALLRELFLEDSHSVTAMLVPSHTLGEEKAAREAARIAKERTAWTPEQIAELVHRTETLTAWQQTPDSQEALATIPMLRRSDLKDRPEPVALTADSRDGVTVLRHKTAGSLVRFKTIFNLAGLAPEELPAVVLLGQVLGVMGTKTRRGEELQMLVKERIGKLGIQSTAMAGSDPEHCRLSLTVSAVCLSEQAEQAAELIREFLTETAYTDRRLLRDLLQQSAMDAQMALSAAGHRYAVTRIGAYNTAHGTAREYLGGFELVRWLKRQSTASDETLDELLATLRSLADRIFTADRLTLSCTENCSSALESSLLRAFPKTGEIPGAEASIRPLGARHEGIQIPAAVGFAARGGSLCRYGMTYSGSLPILANILNYVYLWGEIRVQGGAYGCGFVGRDDGDVGFYTYRDPKPGRSLDVMDGAADFLRGFCAEDPDLDGFVLGAVSSLDPLLNEESRMALAESRYFKGVSDADICRRYQELVRTTKEDLLALAPILEQIAADGMACVVGGAAQLDACGSHLDSRLTL